MGERINHDLLREREDHGVGAVKDLPRSAQWAALEFLIYHLNLRPLTQVDVSREKVLAFRKENQS